MSKPESERPAGCKFWVADDVVDWISKHVYFDNIGDETPKKSALWWKANLDADSMSDLNHRELAELCLDGSLPTTLEDVTEEVQLPHEDCGNDVADIDGWLESNLRSFFGVRKGNNK